MANSPESFLMNFEIHPLFLRLAVENGYERFSPVRFSDVGHVNQFHQFYTFIKNDKMLLKSFFIV